MNKEDLYRAVGEAGEDLLERSEQDAFDVRARRHGFRRWAGIAAAAAVLFLIASVGIRLSRWRSGSSAPLSSQAAYETAEAPEEEMAVEEALEEAETDEAADADPENGASMIDTGIIHDKAALIVAANPVSLTDGADQAAGEETADSAGWSRETSDGTAVAAVYGSGWETYLKESASGLLRGGKTENTVYSPLNLYISLAMLTEITKGESREELTGLLHAETAGEPREVAEKLFAGASYEKETGTSLPAASVWLRNEASYHMNPLQRLASSYHASSFAGEMGSPEYDTMLRTWVGEATGGLLACKAENLSFDELTEAAIAGTLYYKAAWEDPFSVNGTREEVFHAADEDVTVPMMHQQLWADYIEANGFTAAALPLADGNKMWFLLPEDDDADALLADGAWTDVLHAGSETGNAVYITVPAFETVSGPDVRQWMEDSGVSRLFHPSEDFSPLTEERLFLSEIDHAAYLSVDEDGVTGAAYTYEEAAAEDAMEDVVEFTLDRPFLYVIADDDGAVWFAGVVRKP